MASHFTIKRILGIPLAPWKFKTVRVGDLDIWLGRSVMLWVNPPQRKRRKKEKVDLRCIVGKSATNGLIFP